jgi:hypothetical protein
LEESIDGLLPAVQNVPEFSTDGEIALSNDYKQEDNKFTGKIFKGYDRYEAIRLECGGSEGCRRCRG